MIDWIIRQWKAFDAMLSQPVDDPVLVAKADALQRPVIRKPNLQPWWRPKQ